MLTISARCKSTDVTTFCVSSCLRPLRETSYRQSTNIVDALKKQMKEFMDLPIIAQHEQIDKFEEV
jgi:hypothetical protein